MADVSTVVSNFLKGATTTDQATGDAPVSSQSLSSTGEESVVRAEESTVDDFLNQKSPETGSEDNPQDSSETGEPNGKAPVGTQAKSPKTSNKEIVTISDDKGRRKVEVDFADREGLKKYIQMAHGARKWQAERDQAKQEVSKVSEELGNLKSTFKALEDAYSNGIEGLVDLLEGRRGAYKDFESRIVEKRKFLEKASPEELELFQTREEIQKLKQSEAKRAKELDSRLKEMDSQRENAEIESTKAQVTPVFHKHRFAGKLGNADDENMFDEMLWNTALKRLEPYEEQGLLTQERINEEFDSVAKSLRRRISGLAEKKASKVVEQKKKEATENVQARVMSGYKTGGTAKEAADLVNSGNLTSLLKGWKKYGSVFGGG